MWSFALIYSSVALYSTLVPPVLSFMPVTSVPKTFLDNALISLKSPAYDGKSTDQSTIMMAGFGGGTPSKKKSKDRALPPPLKAKQQWDRYGNLKGTIKCTVGVRVDGSEEWMTVGYVRSKDDAFSKYAVARQRALIAGHARKLNPIKVAPKSTLEWGAIISDEWTTISKEEANNDSVSDKEIGFEGLCDPNTGFYCHYKDGKIVDELSG